MSPTAKALSSGLPIGLLAGLIGVGGGEFRLPLLVLLFALTAKAAVPLNLVISLVTLTGALLIRLVTLPALPIATFGPAVLGLTLGAVISACLAPALLKHVSDHRFEQILAVLLVLIGLILILEAFVPLVPLGLVAPATLGGFSTGIGFGLGIGVVAALLGVAGGEFLIPTLIVVFGASALDAGTLSLAVSIPTVSAGLVRYHRLGLFPPRHHLTAIALPMGLGSLAGAALGGLLAAFTPDAVIKASLGLVLIAAALKTFTGRH